MAAVPAHIFREYDIRGLHATELRPDVVRNIGKALGTELLRRGEKTICVGHDVRTSSPRLKDNIVEGLLSTGITIHFVGMLPTPALYFSVIHLKAGGGLQITGSHNPVEFNGFKMTHGTSGIYGEQIQHLREIIERDDFETGEGTLVVDNVLDAYYGDLRSRIGPLPRKLKVVVDAGNGAASEIAPRLLADLGCEVIPLYCAFDGDFPNHLPDPTVMEYIRDLIATVKKTGADVGIGYDGDADRIGAIDENGEVVPGDRLLGIFAGDTLTRVPGAPIIFDVKCSQALPEYIEKRGGKPVMWKSGHSLVKAKMKETKAPVAGEMSGHIFFREGFHGYDDAIYASARLLSIVAKSGRTLGDIAREMPKYVSTPEIRVETTDEDKFRIVKEVGDHFRKDHEVIDIDGARVLFGDGWGLIRASNTQPVLVMRFEAKTDERLQEIGGAMLDVVKRYPSVKVAGLKIEKI